ncbi:MAG: hypothetical protein ACRDNM_13760 [Gaiellaceae bacterium]
MIGVGIILVVVGVVLVFLVPWAGIPVGLVGLALVALWLAGFGRRVIRGGQPH